MYVYTYMYIYIYIYIHYTGEDVTLAATHLLCNTAAIQRALGGSLSLMICWQGVSTAEAAKCPTWTSSNRWGYNIQQIPVQVMFLPKKGLQTPSPVVSKPGWLKGDHSAGEKQSQFQRDRNPKSVGKKWLCYLVSVSRYQHCPSTKKYADLVDCDCLFIVFDYCLSLKVGFHGGNPLMGKLDLCWFLMENGRDWQHIRWCMTMWARFAGRIAYPDMGPIVAAAMSNPNKVT